jgi:predicted amidohydrolase
MKDAPQKDSCARVASITWGIAPITGVDEFFQHLCALVEDAARRGGSVVLLPELFEVELLKTMPDGPTHAVATKLAPFATLIDDTLRRLAQSLHITIIGGSYLRSSEVGIVNVSAVAFPDGALYFQPKNCRTQWEIEPWGLQQQFGLQRFPNPRLGVLVCYDSEFPEAARAVAEAGIELLCVPSYTESQHGYQRVNWSCKARAIENEIFVAQSCIVGEIECFGLGTGYGQSSIIAPSKEPFPASAILAESPLNTEAIAVADVDFDALAQCRSTGDARPWSDRRLAPWTF